MSSFPCLMPDWRTFGTRSQIEGDIGTFGFNGPGWYVSGNDTLLVVEDDNRGSADPTYTVFVWNVPNARDSFAAAAALPMYTAQHGDTRSESGGDK